MAATLNSTQELKQLKKLAHDAKRSHLAREKCRRGGAWHALLTGRALSEAKSHIKHGEWLKWLRDMNLPFGERQAQRYMQVADLFPNPTRASDLDETSIRKILQMADGKDKDNLPDGPANKASSPETVPTATSQVNEMVVPQVQNAEEHPVAQALARRESDVTPVLPNSTV